MILFRFFKNIKHYLWRSQFVLLFGTIVSLLIAIYFYQEVSSKEKKIVQEQISKVEHDFGKIFEIFTHPLEGIKSSIHFAKFQFNHYDFQLAAESRNYFKNFEGAIGFGFIRKIESGSIDQYIDHQKSLRSDFELKWIDQKSQNQDIFVIEMVEPIATNKPAIGLVVSSEERRRNAAVESMKSGQPIVSLPIQLVQLQQSEPGFLLYLPIYQTPTTPPSEEQRLSQLYGWAYTPLRLSAIIKYIQTQNPSLTIQGIRIIQNENELSVYQKDGLIESNNNINISLQAYGKNWSMQLKTERLNMWSAKIKATIIFLLSFMTTLILFYALRHQENVSRFKSELIKRTKSEVDQAVQIYSEQKLFLQKVIDNIPAMVGYWDKNYRNVLANNAYYNFFGLTPQQINKMTIQDLLGDRYFKNEPYVEAVLKGHEQSFERELMTPQGKRQTLAKYLPDIVDGEVIGFFVVVFDVTEIRELQEIERKQQEKLNYQSRLTTLGEMAGGIAHEINNPIAIIKGKAQLLQLEMDLNLKDHPQVNSMKNHLQKIDQTVDRISSIIKGMRSLSRNADEDVMEYSLVSDMIDEVISVMREKIKLSGVQLSFDKNIAENTTLFCNKTQLQQVLLNLLSNSLYEVALLPTEKWIKIVVQNDNDYLKISVIDSGRGVSAEIENKMMNPFFTTKPPGQGTGLGLSLSQNIIQKHGGNLDYCLLDGHTAFSIKIPIRQISGQVA